jgi:hypothetical protein
VVSTEDTAEIWEAVMEEAMEKALGRKLKPEERLLPIFEE